MHKSRFISSILIVIVLGFMVPQSFINPVVGADSKRYHTKSFWYYPWGKSGTHKGVDIFASQGMDVVSSTRGIVIFKREVERSGNVVLVLGPKWRIHYYAHLQNINAPWVSYLSPGES
jgi:murein DD-endopeptidase MepM/ murein hydrolase activator NlpD